MDHWSHYLISHEFILFLDYEALKYINGQHKLNNLHVKWVEFLQDYNFHTKHKSDNQNQTADALSQRHSLLSTVQVEVIGFKVLKESYKDDPYFNKIVEVCLKDPSNHFLLQSGFILKVNRVCILQSSFREFIIKEAHGGGLDGYLVEIKHFLLSKRISIDQEWIETLPDMWNVVEFVN